MTLDFITVADCVSTRYTEFLTVKTIFYFHVGIRIQGSKAAFILHLKVHTLVKRRFNGYIQFSVGIYVRCF